MKTWVSAAATVRLPEVFNFAQKAPISVLATNSANTSR